MSSDNEGSNIVASTIDAATAAELNNLLRQLSSLQEKNYFADLIYIPSESLQSSLNGGEIDDNIFFLVQNAQLLISRLILLAEGSDGTASNQADPRLMAPLTLLTELTMTLRSFVYDLLPSELQQQVGEDGAPLDGTTAFNHAISQRAVPLEHIVQSLFVLSFVTTKLRLELVLAQLKANLKLEMNVDGLNKELSEYKSLQMVYTLLSDFEAAYKNVLRFVPATLELNQGTEQQQQQRSQAELQQFADMVSRYYYQLADWLLQVDLTVEASQGLFRTASGEKASGALTAHVTKVELDAAEGIVNLSLAREDATMPWGLLFNEQGKLVDVDLFVRLHASSSDSSQRLSGRGEIAHQLLKLSRTGATIVSINDNPVLQAGDDANNASVYAQRAMTALQQLSATKMNEKTGEVTGRKRLQLRVRSEGFKRFTASDYIFPTRCTLPRVIVSGAAVSLAFAKVSQEARWPFVCEDEIYTLSKKAAVVGDPNNTQYILFHLQQSVLEDRNSFMHYLPPETTKFLLEKKDLALVKVNGITVNSSAHAAQLLENSPPVAGEDDAKESAEVVQLDLVVLPSREVRRALFLQKNHLHPVKGAKAVKVQTISMPPPAKKESTLSAISSTVSKVVQKLTGEVPAVPEVPEVDDAEVHRIVKEMSKAADQKASGTAALVVDNKTTAVVALPPQEKGEINLQSAAESIIAELQKQKKERKPKAAKKEKKPKVDTKVVATFDNGVQLYELNDREIVLERPADVPSWGMSIAVNNEVTPPTMELIALPAVKLLTSKNAKLANRYQKQFEKMASKEGQWFIKKVGTKKINNPSDVLQYMSSLKKMKITFWRR